MLVCFHWRKELQIKPFEIIFFFCFSYKCETLRLKESLQTDKISRNSTIYLMTEPEQLPNETLIGIDCHNTNLLLEWVQSNKLWINNIRLAEIFSQQSFNWMFALEISWSRINWYWKCIQCVRLAGKTIIRKSRSRPLKYYLNEFN